MIKNIFFDLDGTLLPMDMKKFMELYFQSLGESVCPYIGIEPELLQRSVLAGLKAMYMNDGAITNKMRFWNTVATILGPKIIDEIPLFNGYYENEFILTKNATNPNPLSAKIVDTVKKKGYNIAIATNPFFPKAGTERRVKWAGLNKEDFSIITTYETSKYSKPNPKYFTETCFLTNCLPEETIMVGNDVEEDMSAEKAGLDTFLVTDNLINSRGVNTENFKQGTLKDFYDFCLSLPSLNDRV